MGTNERDELLMALAQGDGQPWIDLAAATPHAAEMMYGKQADAILASDWLAERDRRVRAEALRRAASLGVEAFIAKWWPLRHLRGLRAVDEKWLTRHADRIEAGQ